MFSGNAEPSFFTYLSKPKAILNVVLDLKEKSTAVAHCFRAVATHLKSLFLNNKTRNALCFQLIQIAGGNMSAVELINTAIDFEGKRPLKMQFNEFDVITQFYILLMLRMIVDHFIKDLPVKLKHEDDGIQLSDDIAHEFQVKANKLRMKFDLRQTIFNKIREGLFKESSLQQMSKKTIAQLEQFISKLLMLLSLDGDFIIPKEIKAPTFEEKDDEDNESEEEDLRRQLKKPYNVSDELRLDVFKLCADIGGKYLQAKKDPTSPNNVKVIQLYHVLKQLNELITNSDSIIKAGETDDPKVKQIIIGIKHYLEPITIHALFFVPEGDVIAGKHVHMDKVNLFDKEERLLRNEPSQLKIIYDSLQKEVLEQMWIRIRRFPLHYDFIMKTISPSTDAQIKNITPKLKERSEIVLDLHKNPELLPGLIPEARQWFAAEALDTQRKNQTISAAMLDCLKEQFNITEWPKNASPYALALIKVIEDLEDELKIQIEQLGKKDFLDLTVYKDEPPLVPKYPTMLKL
ncbi:MAG: hypothetical protein HKM07_08400 [Chlamydiae bacterium]|nr:hypothetical protein [Chlamydiota bacterium]